MKMLGQMLKDTREELGLTQETVAGTEISTRTLQRIEDGNGNPKVETLNRIAKAMDASLIIHLGSSNDERLLTMFRRAIPRNQAIILGYIEGLLEGHQSEPGSSGKRAD